MNSENIYSAIGNVDDELLGRYDTAMKRKKKILVWRKSIVAVTLCLFVSGAVLSVTSFFLKGTQSVCPPCVSEKSQSVTSEVYILPHWDEMTVSMQYFEFSWNGGKYSSRVIEIPSSDIEKPLEQTLTLTGTDEYANKQYQIQASLHKIKGISSNCAVAVKFEGDEAYYPYINYTYHPETLGQFIEDLSLKDTLYFNNLTCEITYAENITVEPNDADRLEVWEMLFSDLTAKSAENFDSMNFREVANISVDISRLSYSNISVAVTEDGYITTNILDTGKAFYVGEEVTSRFIDYIRTHPNGKKQRVGEVQSTSDAAKTEETSDSVTHNS